MLAGLRGKCRWKQRRFGPCWEDKRRDQSDQRQLQEHPPADCFARPTEVWTHQVLVAAGQSKYLLQSRSETTENSFIAQTQQQNVQGRTDAEAAALRQPHSNNDFCIIRKRNSSYLFINNIILLLNIL